MMKLIYIFMNPRGTDSYFRTEIKRMQKREEQEIFINETFLAGKFQEGRAIKVMEFR